MCERSPLALLFVAAALVAPAPAAAQQATEEELVRHLHELLPRLDSARRAADQARARAIAAKRAPVSSVDTFQVGPLHILAPSDEHRVAEAFFREAWESGFARFVDTSPSLERTTFTFQWTAEPGRIPVEGPERRVELLAWRPASVVRANVVAAISRTLGEDLSGPLADWAGRAVRDPRATASDVYTLAAVRPSLSNRRCIGGYAEACWTSLGLDLDATPLDEWYAPEERRAMAAAWGQPLRDVATWRACVDDGNDGACDLYLTQHRPVRNPPLNQQSAKEAMVWLALTAGGEGAWERLRSDSTATPAAALRAASGLDTDALATLWRDWLMSGAPPTRARFDPGFLIDLLWIIAFAAFATRSTRWRLR